jgi:hypothetical protein
MNKKGRELRMAQGKRVMDGYAELHKLRLDGVEEIVAENSETKPAYRLYECRRDNPLGIDEYRVVYEDRDYLKVMREFVKRLGARLDALDLDRIYRGAPMFTDAPILPGDCMSSGMDANLIGKVIAVKQEALSPEFRAASHQIHLATGGFGCAPHSIGRAVYCTNLYSGEQTRFSREDVLGVVDEASNILPEWARAKLADLRDPGNRESILAKLREGRKAMAKQPHVRKEHRGSSEPEL